MQYGTSTTYDALNRPTAVAWNPTPTAAAPTASSVTFGHTYNKANQRVGQTVSDNSWLNYPAPTASTVSYTANALNQYTAVGPVTPTYDANGNLTSDGTFTFGYDARNRLTSASGAGNTASYSFDAQGRRKTKTVNGTTTIFVTDADNREVLEYDGSSGAIQRWYAYGIGANAVLNQTNVTAATRTALIPDIQGSIIATLDSATATLTKTGYLPYGKSANAPASFGYTAQRIDSETNGLYYYRTRHYSPVLGRFLQTDPTGAKGGINLYAYARNDPLNFGDETGKAPDAPSSTAGQNFNFSEQIDVPEEDEDEEGALAGSIRNVNPLGGTTNCVNCAAAADATLGGAPASALDSGPQSIFNLGTNWNPVSGPLQIGSILSQSGNGSTGIVYGAPLLGGGNVGHVWSAINNGGDIQFLDAQTGGGGLSNFDQFQNYQFLLTRPGG